MATLRRITLLSYFSQLLSVRLPAVRLLSVTLLSYFSPLLIYFFSHHHLYFQTCGQLLSTSVMLMYLRRVMCTAMGSLPKKSSYAERLSTADTAETPKVNPQISLPL